MPADPIQQDISRNQVPLRSLNRLIVSGINTVIGHGEAAVKLQRDWVENPQTLPFAEHINRHALVSLVHKGLLYHEIEASVKQVCNIL